MAILLDVSLLADILKVNTMLFYSAKIPHIFNTMSARASVD